MTLTPTYRHAPKDAWRNRDYSNWLLTEWEGYTFCVEDAAPDLLCIEGNGLIHYMTVQDIRAFVAVLTECGDYLQGRAR